MDNLKRILIAAMCLSPSLSHATQSSMLCKTDTNEYIDVVSKGEQTNDVLVQINGGRFFDGHTLLMNGVLIVIVDFIGGGMMLNMQASGEGNMIISLNEKTQSHTVKCQFR